jgi:hypothetical protein
MSEFSQWLSEIGAKTFGDKLPTWKSRAEHTICYITPPTDMDGMAKFLIPAFILGTQHPNIRTLVTSLGENRDATGKYQDEFDTIVNTEYIRVSTHVVFPTFLEDLSTNYKKIREINPRIKILFYLDLPITGLPPDHPLEKKYPGHLIENILFADELIVESPGMDADKTPAYVDTIYKAISQVRGVRRLKNIMMQPYFTYFNRISSEVNMAFTRIDRALKEQAGIPIEQAIIPERKNADPPVSVDAVLRETMARLQFQHQENGTEKEKANSTQKSTPEQQKKPRGRPRKNQ